MKLIQKILYYFCVRCRPGRTKTVSYTFSALLIITGAMVTAALLSSKSSEIRLVSSVSTVEAGKPFTVSVYANALVPVNAVDITLGFSEENVEVKEIDTGRSVITLWTTEPQVDGGKIVLRGGTFRKGFLGEHLIASIDLEAKVTGSANFSLNDVTFLAGDGSGTNVELGEGETELTVMVNSPDGVITASGDVIVLSDLDGDGKVTFSDVQSFMSAWKNKTSLYDFNNDNKMTFTDFAIILADSFRR